VNPLGHGTGRLGHAGRARGEAGWAAVNSARSQFPIKKFFFFFQIYFVNYKSIWIQIKFEFQ
jgi:hypothetical protein